MGKRKTSSHRIAEYSPALGLRSDYWLFRDYEYVQLLHDLAFFLEVDSLAKGAPVPEYRAFSLFRAAYSLDSYGTAIDRWLIGDDSQESLDYVPSKRIREYLMSIKTSGTLPELRSFTGFKYERARRMRAVRGIGASAIAGTFALPDDGAELFEGNEFFRNFSETARSLFRGKVDRKWQCPHVVPPLMRFLNAIEREAGRALHWVMDGISDPLVPITSPLQIQVAMGAVGLSKCVAAALKTELLFSRNEEDNKGKNSSPRICHQMGWEFSIKAATRLPKSMSLVQAIMRFDPLALQSKVDTLLGDFHLHTTWSDGSASPESMAEAAFRLGLKYIFVTDHSRSSKLQSGLTPPMWIRQAGALAAASSPIPILQGLEVDILADGSLDLPPALLRGTQLVIGSVHTGWTDSVRANTERLLSAIETGLLDVVGHASSKLLGKMGVPDYTRPAAPLDWSTIFAACAEWKVALEFNCFPSRFDLDLTLLTEALEHGCMISFGSDAHAREHLIHLKFGAFALARLDPKRVLNSLTLTELTGWLTEARANRASLRSRNESGSQALLPFSTLKERRKEPLLCSIAMPQALPQGSVIVGIDLTAGEKQTGICVLRGNVVETQSVKTDQEIYEFIKLNSPAIVSIDSPLGLPGGGVDIDAAAGIVREAERDLLSIGISAYPALIDSMRNLTLRGIRLRNHLEGLPSGPQVIESYPGAAQDILRIPRKQRGLEHLRQGLRRLGLVGFGLDTQSHDEMDSITSAVVGRYYELGEFEAMGIPSEAQLIVPKVAPLIFKTRPVVCLTGRTGSGKSVVARYLSVFYGFEWIRTRDLIRSLLVADQSSKLTRKLSHQSYDVSNISERDLQEFGAVILNEHGQMPLRRELMKAINASQRPVVVDSIRDVSDFKSLETSFLRVWFVDSYEAQIQKRLATRTKLGAKRLMTRPLIDSKSSMMKNLADDVLDNNSSLEALRWKVDDTLFNSLEFVTDSPESYFA